VAADGGSARGWGTGLGAADVSGGPYHIKLAAVDGASAGNRDNQIMSNAIIKIVAQGSTMGSTATPGGDVVVGSSGLTTVHDQANLQVADTAHPPTGNAVFSLYGPFTTAPTAASDCVDPVSGSGGNRLAGPITASSWSQVGTSNVYNADMSALQYVNLTTVSGLTLAAGQYFQWVVNYVPNGDQYNKASTSDCSIALERFHLTKKDTTGTSVQTVFDTVTVSGYGTPTGTVNWYLYKTSDCSNNAAGDLVGSDVVGVANDGSASNADDGNNSLNVNGKATSKGFTVSPAAGGTTYYWLVSYDGSNDPNNNSNATVEPCGVQQVRVQNAPATP
jgi:hypothetical protein